MNQPVVPSPCRKICQLNQQDVCLGCGRTRGEVAQWFAADPRRQQEIVLSAANRLQNLPEYPSNPGFQNPGLGATLRQASAPRLK